MFIRASKQRRSDGSVRCYAQLVESYRREDGRPTHRVIAHLGPQDEETIARMRDLIGRRKAAPSSSRNSPPRGLRVGFRASLLYLPLVVVIHFFRSFALDRALDELAPGSRRSASIARVTEALVAHRCVAPGSKLAFNRWLETTALAEVLGVAEARLNNTRVHRAMDALSEIDDRLQDEVAHRVIRRGRPRVLYLDLTDTWFEAGGGELARKGKTKEGHRSKLKIHIALAVNEHGLPIRWKLLPGALNETTVLPGWLSWLHEHPELSDALLVFDRGLPSIDNFVRLVDPAAGHVFLTSVKSDSISTYVTLGNDKLDALQALPDDAPPELFQKACTALGLKAVDPTTYATDLGLRRPPPPKTRGRTRAPTMRCYLYFNPEIQRTKREGRNQRLMRLATFIDELNADLRRAKKSRSAAATTKKVDRVLDKLRFSEAFDVELTPHEIAGRSRAIKSFQVTLRRREQMLRNMARYDGLSLLVAHPEVTLSTAEAIAAYRCKDAVEADFRTIKSVLGLRPVFHRTTHKIDAHVTICVLALLVERLIERQLAESGLPPELVTSAPALLENLASVQRSRITIDGKEHSGRTPETDSQRRVLEALGLEAHLKTHDTSLTVPLGAL